MVPIAYIYIYIHIHIHTPLAGSILYLSITFVQITYQGNSFITHAFHKLHPWLLWAGPLWAPGALVVWALMGLPEGDPG